jgi:uncharacterized SAM-binding protein YcdF (DUF218 family)
LVRLGITVPEERNIQWMILKAMRVPASAVLQVGERSDSTTGEMAHLVRLLKERRIRTIILVTSRSHSTRASKILARVSGNSLTIISRPTSYDTFNPDEWWRSRADVREVLLEYAKLFDYLVQPIGVGLTGWFGGGSASTVPAESTF